MPNINIQAANITITFTDLNDVKQFVDALNRTEGIRLGFKLTVKLIKPKSNGKM